MNSKKTKEDLFENLEKALLTNEKPSKEIKNIIEEGKEIHPFKMLYNLKNIDQNPKFHPEGSVWNHTLLVVDGASKRKEKSKDSKAFMWAVLLHDIGKLTTTKVRKGRITSYDHDKVGRELSEEFLGEFNMPKELIDKVSSLVRWHMQPFFVVKNLPFADVPSMKNEVDVNEIALLSLCDRMGRGEGSEENIEEEKKQIKLFLEKCK